MTSHPKVAVITASYSGIGFELSRQLLRKGFQLAVLNRDAHKTRDMIQQIKQEFPSAQIHSYTADLADHPCGKIAADFPEIDALFNNAGVLLPELRYSPQGNEMHFEINTVAPFMLMHLLKPQLANAQNAAVVTSGSGARRMARSLDVAHLKQPQSFKKMSGPYAQSKLAISTACAALEQEFSKAGIRLNVVDINPTKTQMAASDGMPGWIKPFKFLFTSPEKTAQRLMDAAFGSRTPTPSDLPSTAIQQQLLELLYNTSGLRPGQHSQPYTMETTPQLSAVNN
jgi:NAD(P)-dependent dehydrogenase (short-subunit alcohol dehydrogenase family)